MENLEVHNSLAGALGKAHKHPAGIPQGCPLSMMFLAIVMRVAIVVLQNRGIVFLRNQDIVLLRNQDNVLLHNQCIVLVQDRDIVLL